MQNIKNILFVLAVLTGLLTTAYATEKGVIYSNPEEEQRYLQLFTEKIQKDEALDAQVEQFIDAHNDEGGALSDSCSDAARNFIVGDLERTNQSFQSLKAALVEFIPGISTVLQDYESVSFFIQHPEILKQIVDSFEAYKHRAKFTYAVRFAFLNFVNAHDFNTYCGHHDIVKFLIKAMLLWRNEFNETEQRQKSLQQEFQNAFALQAAQEAELGNNASSGSEL